MIPQVQLIGKSVIDFNLFLTAANKGLGRSVSRSLDKRGKDTNTIAAYLAMLAEMKTEDSDPNRVLQDAGALLKQAYYVFQIILNHDTLFELLEQGTLSVHNAECVGGLNLSIVSGTLENWRTAIINGCSDQSSYNLRLLFDKFLLEFEKEGLSKIFADYTKKIMTDGTFKLC